MKDKKRLIDANALMESLCTVNAPTPSESYVVEKCIEKVNDAPTVDAVEVVRCKDCKYLHCHSAVDRMFFCNNPKGLKGMPNIVEENPFCPYGERRE